MAVKTAGGIEPPKTAFYNDPFIRGLLYQALVVLLVIGLFAWLIINAVINLRAQGKTFGFDFLWNTAGFDVLFKLIPYDRSSTYFDVFLVGLTNTLFVAVIAIVLSTILGFVLGIARLSKNWLVSRIAAVYVEVSRNIPLLLQLFIWYFSVLKVMPAVKQSLNFGDLFFLNARGLYIPVPIFDDRFIWVVAGFAVAVAGVVFFRGWAKQRLEQTGQRFPVFLPSIGILLVVTALAYLVSGTQIDFSVPVLGGFNFKGGFALPPELVALVLGLSFYHATYIGENVRAGIEAVSHGQTEAALSLGLRDNDRLRLVIIPQAMRVIIPPTTSEYLSCTKNSTLGAAIAFPELASVFTGTALNQAGRAIEIVGMTMAVYLTFSLVTSLLMNIYNSRVAIVER